jgi:hypothetical protein
MGGLFSIFKSNYETIDEEGVINSAATDNEWDRVYKFILHSCFSLSTSDAVGLLNLDEKTISVLLNVHLIKNLVQPWEGDDIFKEQATNMFKHPFIMDKPVTFPKGEGLTTSSITLNLNVSNIGELNSHLQTLFSSEFELKMFEKSLRIRARKKISKEYINSYSNEHVELESFYALIIAANHLVSHVGKIFSSKDPDKYTTNTKDIGLKYGQCLELNDLSEDYLIYKSSAVELSFFEYIFPKLKLSEEIEVNMSLQVCYKNPTKKYSQIIYKDTLYEPFSFLPTLSLGVTDGEGIKIGNQFLKDLMLSVYNDLVKYVLTSEVPRNCFEILNSIDFDLLGRLYYKIKEFSQIIITFPINNIMATPYLSGNSDLEKVYRLLLPPIPVLSPKALDTEIMTFEQEQLIEKRITMNSATPITSDDSRSEITFNVKEPGKEDKTINV